MFCDFFQKLYHLWDNMEKYIVGLDRPPLTIMWCMCFAYWITKATNTYSEYLILIAFLCLWWSHKCLSVLCYTYVACLVLTGLPRDTVWLWRLIGLSRFCHLSWVLMCHKMINFYRALFMKYERSVSSSQEPTSELFPQQFVPSSHCHILFH
jgi:hypothetical protein